MLCLCVGCSLLAKPRVLLCVLEAESVRLAEPHQALEQANAGGGQADLLELVHGGLGPRRLLHGSTAG